jgi:phage head maturation protease
MLIPPFSSRLVPLCDGRLGLRGTISVGVDAHPAEQIENHPAQNGTKIENCLDFISSDETLDRFHESISPAGWQLANYRRNPVFQNAHQYGDIIFTLGRALITEVRSVAGRQALFQRIQFATEANPIARIAYNLYKGKFLNAVSVGFIPMRWEDGERKRELGEIKAGIEPGQSEIIPRRAGQESKVQRWEEPFCGIEGQQLIAAECERRSPVSPEQGEEFSVLLHTRGSEEAPRRRFLEQELLEVSAVGIPANPNALALGLKSGAIGKSDIRETMELLRQITSSEESKIDPSSEAELRRVENQKSKMSELINVLRDLRSLFKKV